MAELAHTNIPGSRHARRYKDVEELLAAGINVYTTLNIQHLETLNDIVAQITGVTVRETVPDRVLEIASQIQNYYRQTPSFKVLGVAARLGGRQGYTAKPRHKRARYPGQTQTGTGAAYSPAGATNFFILSIFRVTTRDDCYYRNSRLV